MNWFGRMYYGDKKQYKRSLRIAFKCWFWWDFVSLVWQPVWYMRNRQPMRAEHILRKWKICERSER